MEKAKLVTVNFNPDDQGERTEVDIEVAKDRLSTSLSVGIHGDNPEQVMRLSGLILDYLDKE